MRKKFLVKPALQLRYLGFTLLIVAVSSIGVYIVFETTLWTSLSLIPLTDAQASTLQNGLRLSFTWTLLILLAACGLESYLYFHRVVGPLFVLERELKRIAEGDFGKLTRIRQGDELHDLFNILDTMKHSLNNHFDRQAQTLQETAKTLERLAQELPTQDRLGCLRQEVIALKERISYLSSNP